MKKLLTSILLIALAAVCPSPGLGQGNYESDPAYLAIDKFLDLKTVRPEVNVNLPHFLLKDAISDLDTGTNGPLAGLGGLADVIKDVKLIRVVVIPSNKSNKPALDGAVKALRADLDAKWTPIVSVPEENVGIYALGDPSGESTAGIALLIADGGEVVIANVVGRVSIGKLVKLAAQMDKLPKDILQKLQGAGSKTTPSSNKKDQGGEKSSKPADAPDAPAK
jgi:hypothetical protein